jgi:hypothetical protein
MVHRIAAAVALVLSLAGPARADEARALYDLLRLDALIEIMRDEGLQHGQTLGRDLLAGAPSSGWAATVDRIYESDRMRDTVLTRFSAAIGDVDLAPLIAYFESDAGQAVIDLELAAREAMIDEAVEEAARTLYRDLTETGGSPRLETLVRFAELNDLVDRNVAGALNASLRFYSGLVEGGAMAMTETDILREVWSSEPETRADTAEWVMSYMLMAYRPLDDAALDRYVALAETPAGEALNAALFDAFNGMYEDISYALGLAVSRQMQAQEL